MEPDTVGAAVENLARRIAELEDREQIARLVSRYGPAVDAGSSTDTAALWADGGRYAYAIDGELAVLEGRESVADMVDGDLHQSIIDAGAGHVLTNPSVELDGDRAVAWNHSMLVRHDPDSGRYYVDRLAANRWLLRRTPDGWLVEERVNRLLDGSSDARELLSSQAEHG